MAVSGLGVRYPRPRNAHHLVGGRAPDIVVMTPTGERHRLHETLRGGRFVLLLPPDAESEVAATEDLEVVRTAQTATTLVRPDGYVAWAAERPTAEELEQELNRWFAGS